VASGGCGPPLTANLGRDLKLKLEELIWFTNIGKKVQAEREEQRHLREQMREDEKALREIEKAKEEAERDEAAKTKALQKHGRSLPRPREGKSIACNPWLRDWKRS
jgi:hypothetical protein